MKDQLTKSELVVATLVAAVFAALLLPQILAQTFSGLAVLLAVISQAELRWLRLQPETKLAVLGLVALAGWVIVMHGAHPKKPADDTSTNNTKEK
jgi:hypothetical protein